jgi:hypothetical protein
MATYSACQVITSLPLVLLLCRFARNAPEVEKFDPFSTAKLENEKEIGCLNQVEGS